MSQIQSDRVHRTINNNNNNNNNNSTVYYIHQNFNTPYPNCPECGQEAIRMMGIPYLFCPAKHSFYECPTCTDTRVVERKENIIYCGLLHPYHICPIHRIPVVGISSYRYDKCTCMKNAEARQVLRSKPISNWDSPYM